MKRGGGVEARGVKLGVRAKTRDLFVGAREDAFLASFLLKL